MAASHPNLDADAEVGQLFRVALAGDEAPRRITRGFADAAPTFSPDGSLLAFLRSGPDAAPQVHVMRAEGGEPVQVTDAKLGVGAFCFSPDGSTMAFTARVPEPGRYGTLEGVGRGQEDPRHITTYQFQANGLGWTLDRPRQVFVVAVPDPAGEPPVKPVGRAAKAAADRRAAAGESVAAASGLVPVARQLTEGSFDHSSPAFTPDGSAVVVVAARADDRDERLGAGVHAVSVLDGSVRALLEDPTRDFGHPCFSRDGTTLYVVGSELGPDGRDFVARNAGVWAVPAAGGEPHRLTDAETVDVVAPGASLVPWGETGVLALDQVRGLRRLLGVSESGVTEVGSGVLFTGAAQAPDGEIIATYATTDSPGEVGRVRAGTVHPLTDFAAPLRSATTLHTPIDLVATASDGYPVHGWVVRPAGPGPHPVLLTIHGGPFADYHPSFFDEFQVYAEAGYAVVACNPRGSAGYGQAHGRAIRHDMGNLDMLDVLAFLDHALTSVDGLDAERVGVQGGSYGGYLTAWLIGHTHRFTAAIVERGYLDPASFIGSSDIGWFFSAEYTGATLAEANRQSPMMFTHAVRTPTLVIHSEDDLRCPLSQALRYYTELKLHGVDAELLVFPGENHELSRSGTPHHRVQRFEAILAWWQRHLSVERA